tara:strand:+ start:364 stop:597 length:234 start_codon:yes stop_codon:yes gene_type:complete
MTNSENKLTQHGVIGLLTAILAVQGWSTVKPDDIHKSVVEHGKEIEALREDQAELRFSIRLLAENVRSLTEAVEKSR